MIKCKCGSSNLRYNGCTTTCVAFGEFTDADGYTHHHDKNSSAAIIKCDDCNEESRIKSFNQCSIHCGWTSEFPDKTYHKERPIDPNQKAPLFKFRSDVVIINDKYIQNLVDGSL